MVYGSKDCVATIPLYLHYIGYHVADYDVASSTSDHVGCSSAALLPIYFASPTCN